MNNRGFEFSFNWIFALIAGAVILSLAIYGVSNFVSVGNKLEGSSRSVELSSLLTGLETGVEQQGTNVIESSTLTRITNGCASTGSTASEKSFGVQTIRTATSSRIGKGFEDNGVPLRSERIYLFSDKVIEGKSFTTLSQSFEYPFKVADVVSIWSSDRKYCFVNSPTEIRTSIQNLNVQGINFTDSKSGCLKDSASVCFSGIGCNITISEQLNSVQKNGKIVYYDSEGSALFYGAIFSDNEIYECQVKRLMNRARVLADIYAGKAAIGDAFGCPATIVASVAGTMSTQLKEFKTSSDLSYVSQIVLGLEEVNNALACKQF